MRRAIWNPQHLNFPGASAREVEEQVTRPMEKFLYEIKGVEYVYSIIKPGENLTIVRFNVGENTAVIWKTRMMVLVAFFL